jgi:hypothetical protein
MRESGGAGLTKALFLLGLALVALSRLFDWPRSTTMRLPYEHFSISAMSVLGHAPSRESNPWCFSRASGEAYHLAEVLRAAKRRADWLTRRRSRRAEMLTSGGLKGRSVLTSFQALSHR